MVKLDRHNSRMKDFHDLWAFDGVRLQSAVATCFERRGTAWANETPRVLPKVAEWRTMAIGQKLCKQYSSYKDSGAG
jgi:hypothetical protein